jgi:hypothetical protein
MGVLSLAVLGFQILIYSTIRIASWFGSGPMWLIAIVWAIVTFGGAVATGGLMALQGLTIFWALSKGSRTSGKAPVTTTYQNPNLPRRSWRDK